MDFNVNRRRTRPGAPAMDDTFLQEDIGIHVFTVSANMLGVCLTVIGLFRVFGWGGKVNTAGKALLIAVATAFLCSCILSYFSLRTRKRRRRHQMMERAADSIFLAGLLLMMLICGLIVYEVV